MKTEYIKQDSRTHIIRALSDGVICAEIVLRVGKDRLPDNISMVNTSLTYSYFRYWCQCQLALPFYVICKRELCSEPYDDDLGLNLK